MTGGTISTPHVTLYEEIVFETLSKRPRKTTKLKIMYKIVTNLALRYLNDYLPAFFQNISMYNTKNNAFVYIYILF